MLVGTAQPDPVLVSGLVQVDLEHPARPAYAAAELTDTDGPVEQGPQLPGSADENKFGVRGGHTFPLK